MKSLMILGGLTGFTLGVDVGLLKNSSRPTMLWRSSVGASIGGLLLKWWGQIWTNSLAEARRQRQEAGESHPSQPTPSPVASQLNE